MKHIGLRDAVSMGRGWKEALDIVPAYSMYFYL